MEYEYAPEENSCPIRCPVPTGQRVLVLPPLIAAARAAIGQHDFRGNRSRQRHIDERVATEEEQDNGHAGSARGVAGQEEAMLVVPLFDTRWQAASPLSSRSTAALGLHSLFTISTIYAAHTSIRLQFTAILMKRSFLLLLLWLPCNPHFSAFEYQSSLCAPQFDGSSVADHKDMPLATDEGPTAILHKVPEDKVVTADCRLTHQKETISLSSMQLSSTPYVTLVPLTETSLLQLLPIQKQILEKRESLWLKFMSLSLQFGN